MSNRTEREQMTALALKEWDAYARVLHERGERWDTTNPASWTLAVYITSGRVHTAVEAAKIIGLRLDFGRLDALHCEQLDQRARAERDALLDNPGPAGHQPRPAPVG